ncbi:MAG: HEAT repeat domain-containing protein [Bacteroidales bacterium]|nr:HEAT repeat domain-containing protein [Bacteroidales bacterium]
MGRCKVFLMLLILAGVVFDTGGQNLVRGEFDRRNFTFHLTFDNDFDYPIYINKIGGICQLNFGDFNCPATRWIPDPIADFIVRLPARNDTLIISTNPVILIPPKKTITFSLAVLPDIRPACESWAIDVTAIVKFHFGYTFFSGSELVMSQDIDAQNLARYTDAEIQTMINSQDANTQIDAINNLQFSEFNTQMLTNFLTSRIKDPDIRVREAAFIAIKDLRLNSMIDQVISHLLASQETGERLLLIQVLEKMSDDKAIDPLIGRILNGDTTETFTAARALIRINNQEIPNKIRFLVQRHDRWASGTREERMKFIYLCNILISYKDMASIQILKNLLTNDANGADVRFGIIASLASLIHNYRVLNDPFINSFKSEYEFYLNNKDDFVRYNSLNLLCATDADAKLKSKIIRKSIKDTEYHIQCRAAVWAGELGFGEFANDLRILCNAAEGPEYIEICEALNKLSQPENN